MEKKMLKVLVTDVANRYGQVTIITNNSNRFPTKLTFNPRGKTHDLSVVDF